MIATAELKLRHFIRSESEFSLVPKPQLGNAEGEIVAMTGRIPAGKTCRKRPFFDTFFCHFTEYIRTLKSTTSARRSCGLQPAEKPLGVVVIRLFPPGYYDSKKLPAPDISSRNVKERQVEGYKILARKVVIFSSFLHTGHTATGGRPWCARRAFSGGLVESQVGHSSRSLFRFVSLTANNSCCTVLMYVKRR